MFGRTWIFLRFLPVFHQDCGLPHSCRHMNWYNFWLKYGVQKITLWGRSCRCFLVSIADSFLLPLHISWTLMFFFDFYRCRSCAFYRHYNLSSELDGLEVLPDRVFFLDLGTIALALQSVSKLLAYLVFSTWSITGLRTSSRSWCVPWVC